MKKKKHEFSYINSDEEKREEINDMLKNLKNEERDLCFPLLDFYFLNKKFKYHNLRESLEINNNVNEYINLRLLRKEIVPKDVSFKTEQKNREMVVHNKLKNQMEEACLKDRDGDLRRDSQSGNRVSNHYSIGGDIKAEAAIVENMNLPHDIPTMWKKNDIIGTFNPVYNARDQVLNDNSIDSIPTIDIFYNSSKLLTIQTVFEPISNYIYLLRLLPKFCLPLYDSGILQYACEDPILNPKLRGLEISYRLLVHDILFYAFFSYLSDLPFWAKPPIELLRIYNYESLYSFNDYESEHTERLVFHNIKNILYNFSDTLNKIELLYPKNYYITIFPNIYFKNIIEFLKSEKFKLKKIVVVLKGKNFIDEKMIHHIKSNLENFRGMTTENVKKEINHKYCPTNNGRNKSEAVKYDTKSVIDAIKRCHNCDEDFFSLAEGKSVSTTKDRTRRKSNWKEKMDMSSRIDQMGEGKNHQSDKPNSLPEPIQRDGQLCSTSPEDTYPSENNNHVDKERATCSNNIPQEEGKPINISGEGIPSGFEKSWDISNNGESSIRSSWRDFPFEDVDKKDERDQQRSHSDESDGKKNGEQGDQLSTIEQYSEEDNSLRKKNPIDMSDNYNIDKSVYNMYYQQENNDREEEASMMESKKFQNSRRSSNSSESSCSEDDETDDENIDGFFKTKKLKSTVYDKDNFSFSKFMNKIINYEKIIDYLNNDPQRQENEDSKIKFYIKLLLFEKANSPYDLNGWTNVDGRENVSDEDQVRSTTFASDNGQIDGASPQGGEDSSIRADGTVSPTDDDDNLSGVYQRTRREGGTSSSATISVSVPNDTMMGRNNSNAADSSQTSLFVNNQNENETRTDEEETVLNVTEDDHVVISSDYISNMIRNLRETYGVSNFLSFSSNEGEMHEGTFNLDDVQDSQTRLTFNFN
ncbi:conserved Plasmodium protein, unknown function [Plasmodium knowlesi strain H]|uniref:Uncharacterized protein n=3 Tax=Plasmodium knowlesi TaxID=5850 RepID=A0A5K1VR50_PLAKH|nr:conserved protein, unknown function [Plasmodium knowlesi strain H]OTN63713.1 Uncharacterized protein PKNOH_S140255100 [Plasmodium knowlesi]CAA9990966.1 conserved protein, unknown function [Plasmodium knowlesi strain H]SBO20798.1 conserved Plasmodium protein, unknown function [Plasmodium knowlesi strain H]SBO21233.1 conserved Plasmodium protein, unknown function [Plasmodium knowlesi strain H]VVS80440.1 conserved protein, unknown function [Plasmodium knowlesi strain H]|eukprot:XP_002262249.1 hypothetical protein, conserved in Plasmodium species [Plasmodium knowlesi strain H]